MKPSSILMVCLCLLFVLLAAADDLESTLPNTGQVVPPLNADLSRVLPPPYAEDLVANSALSMEDQIECLLENAVTTENAQEAQEWSATRLNVLMATALLSDDPPIIMLSVQTPQPPSKASSK